MLIFIQNEVLISLVHLCIYIILLLVCCRISLVMVLDFLLQNLSFFLLPTLYEKVRIETFFTQGESIQVAFTNKATIKNKLKGLWFYFMAKLKPIVSNVLMNGRKERKGNNRETR